MHLHLFSLSYPAVYLFSIVNHFRLPSPLLLLSPKQYNFALVLLGFSWYKLPQFTYGLFLLNRVPSALGLSPLPITPR